jgi:uncharacterized membrane-anchored protein YhcB (DUF1043 family)
MTWLWSVAAFIVGALGGALYVGLKFARPARRRFRLYQGEINGVQNLVDEQTQTVLALTLTTLREPDYSMLVGRLHDALGDDMLHSLQARAQFLKQSGQAG